MNIQEQIKQFEDLIKQEFPHGNNYDYIYYDYGLKSVTIDGSGYNLQQFIDFHRNSIKFILEGLVEREEELLNKPNPQELLFSDCPNCGQETNKIWIRAKVTEIHDEAKQDTISHIQSLIKSLEDIK